MIINLSKNPFLIWIFSFLVHSILLTLVYSVFWASYSQTTLDFIYSFNKDGSNNFSLLSLLLLFSLGFSFSAILAQLLISLSDFNPKLRVLVLYILVFFVAFIPMFLWLDRHVIATICVLCGVNLLFINTERNASFYTAIFIGTFLCLIGLFWSIKGFGWAMITSIPFSLWYLKKENIKNQFAQIIILVSLIMFALVWDLIQNKMSYDETPIRFSAMKITKNVPEWLLDEYLIELNWSKNDFLLWLDGFEGFDVEEDKQMNQYFSEEDIQQITEFLLHYDVVFNEKGNPILEFQYVLLQLALLIFWFLFLGNYNLSRYRLITYWTVVFLIWIWTKYISQDTENGFLLALCAYGGLLPLIGANKFKDIVSFKIHQKIIFVVIVLLVIIELSGSLTIYISKSLHTRKDYVEAKANLENIYKKSSLSSQETYIDWNANLNNKVSLPFFPPISQSNKDPLKDNLIIPIQKIRNKTNEINLSTVYFILPSQTSKSQTSMLTLYFSEHHNKLVEWKLVWKTDKIEVWKLIIF